MNITKKYFMYFSSSLEYFPRSIIIVILIILFDYYPIYFLSISTILDIKGNFNNNYSNLINTYDNCSLIKTINSVFFLKKSDNFSKSKVNILYLSLIFGFIVIYVAAIVLSNEKWIENKIENNYSQNKHDMKQLSFKKKIEKSIYIILPYVYDIFFYRIASFSIIYVLMRSILFFLYNKNYLFLVSFSVLLLYLLSSLFYLRSTHIILPIDTNIANYPFDDYSSLFEMFMMIIKVCLSLSVNYKFLRDDETIYTYNYIYYENIFGIISSFLILSFISGTLYLFFFKDTYIITITNCKINFFRFSLLLLTTFSIIVHTIFDSLSFLIFNLISHTGLVILCMTIMMWLHTKRYKKIIKSKGTNPNLFLFVINEVVVNSKEVAMNIIRELLMTQYSKCMCKFISTSPCQICLMIDEINKEENCSFLTLKKMLITFLYQNLEKDQDNRRYAKLIYALQKTRKNYFLFSIKYQKYINSYINTNPSLALELMTFYKDLLVSQNFNVTSKVNFIKNNELLSQQIFNFVNLLKNTLFSHGGEPYLMIKNSLILRKMKLYFKRELSEKHENNLTYQIIIIKYILESALNKKLKFYNNTLFNINYYDDFLNEHYNNDKQFTFKYNLKTKIFTIIRTGKDFSNIKGENLKELFPFGNYALHSLEKILKETDEKVNSGGVLFYFPVKDFQHNLSYINSCKMKIIVLPTIDLEECLILSLYQTESDNIIVSYIDDSNEENILTYNYNLNKYLCFSPQLIIEMGKVNRNLPFKCVLNENTSSQEYYFAFGKYINLYGSYIKFLKDIYIDRDEDKKVITNVTKAYDALIKDHHCNPQRNKKLKLNYRREYYYQNSKPIIVYSFSQDITTGGNQLYSTIKNKDSFELPDFENLTNKGTLTNTALISNIMMNSHSSVIYSVSVDQTSHNVIKNPELIKQLESERIKKRNQYKHFTWFTYMIFIFNLFLIFLSIIYLIIEISKNDQLNESYSFFIQFINLEKIFMTLSLNLFYSQCVAEQNSTKCQSIVETYSKQYITQYNFTNNFMLSEFLHLDLSSRADTTSGVFADFKKKLLSSKNKEFHNISNQTINFKYISVVGEHSKINIKNMTFIDGISVYLTTIFEIVNNKNFLSIPIYFIDHYGDSLEEIDISNIKYNEGFEKIQQNSYNILLNFRDFMILINKLHNEIEKNIRGILSNNKLIVYIFTILLILFHIFLFVIYLSLIITFKKILISHFTDIINNLTSKNISLFLPQKIDLLLILSSFYKENPNTLISTLEKLNREYSRAEKEELSKKEGPVTIITQGKDNKNLSKLLVKGVVKEIISYTIKGLYYVFIFFFAITMIYLIFLQGTLSTYSNLVSIIVTDSHIDALIYSMSGTLEIIIKTNQSDNQLAKKYGIDPSQGGYVVTKVKSIYTKLQAIEKGESVHQKTIKKLADSIDLGCDSVVNTTMDIIGNSVIKRMEGKDVLNNLIKLCHGLQILNQKNDKILLMDVAYKLMLLINSIEDNSYSGLLKVCRSENMFSYFLEIMLFFRVIRNFEMNYLYKKFFDGTNIKYNQLIFSYLVIIIIFEVSLFIGQRMLIIRNFITINKGIYLVRGCTKV